ncbi:MAG: BrnT family toxin [Acidobacteriota bacterium]|nr:BrnT family toxin [Acidobacteriota bacterium]
MTNYRTEDGFEFEWNEDKNRSNQSDHRVSFQEAATVFADPLSLVTPDDEHSMGEKRYHIIGSSVFNELLTIAYTERQGKIHIITARTPTRRERKEYEEGN